MTASELAKAAREALQKAQRSGGNGLTPAQCSGRYIDYMTIDERSYAAVHGEFKPGTLARIEQRISEDAGKAGNAPQPKTRRTFARRGAAQVSALDADEVSRQLSTADDIAAQVPGFTHIGRRGIIFPPLDLMYWDQTTEDVGYGTTAFATNKGLGEETWRRAKDALKAISRPVYGSAAYEENLKYWRVCQIDAALLRPLSLLYTEVNRATGQPLNPAPAAPQVQPRVKFPTIPNEGEAINLPDTAPRGTTPDPLPAPAKQTKPQPVAIKVETAEDIFGPPPPPDPQPRTEADLQTFALVSGQTLPCVTGRPTYEEYAAAYLRDYPNRLKAWEQDHGKAYREFHALDTQPSTGAAQAIQDAAALHDTSRGATVHNPQGANDNVSNQTSLTVHAARTDQAAKQAATTTTGDSLSGPRYFIEALAMIDPATCTDKDGLTGSVPTLESVDAWLDLAGEGDAKQSVKELFQDLAKRDPQPVMPTAPDPSTFDPSDMSAYLDANAEYTSAVVSMAPTIEGWSNRTKERKARFEAITAELTTLYADREAIKAQRARTAAAAAKQGAIRTKAREAAATLTGAYIPSINPHYKFDKSLDALFVALTTALANEGHAPHTLLTGPAGTGKTTIAQQFAAKMGVPFVSVECSLQRDATRLFGHWTASPTTGTRFVPTLFTRALETGNCVLLLDEVNRFPDPSVSNGLLPMLDYRKRAYIDDIEREIAIGENLLVFATRNQGGKFVGTTATDAALESRFGLFHETRHLTRQETEELLAAATPGLAKTDAARLAKVADALRQAYETGTLSQAPAQREDLEAARMFVLMGSAALRFTYANRYSPTDLGAGAERTHVNGLIQGAFPDYPAAK